MKDKGYFLMFGVGILASAYGFRLSIVSFFIITITVVVTQILLLYFVKKLREKEREFWNMTSYMDQLICSYKRLGHIRLALQDCCSIATSSDRLYKMLQRAIHILETGEGAKDDNIVTTALSEISLIYNSRRIRLLHHFLCQTDKMGGEVAEALDILMTDLQMWKRRSALLLEEKKTIIKEYLLSLILGLVLCLFSHTLIPVNELKIIEKTSVYQVSTCVVYVFLVGASLVFFQFMTKGLGEKQREEKNSIALEFSYWILAVTIYLQNNGIYQALILTKQEVTGVFLEEVDKLLAKIYDNPASLEPYLEFCSKENIPEIQTGMKLLYAVNQNGYQDTKKQVNMLVEQNQLLMDYKERMIGKSRIAIYRLFKQIPMVVAGGKIILDVLLFLYVVAGNLSFLSSF